MPDADWTLHAHPFDPSKPPVTAHANDDEFADASVGGAWTEWDPGSDVTVTEDAYGLKIVNANTSGPSWGGVRRSLPAGDFAVTTKMGVSGTLGNQQACAFIVAADLAGSPSTAAFMAIEANTVGSIRVASWTDFDTFGSQLDLAATITRGLAVYARMRSISGVYKFDTSTDGIAWVECYSATPGFTPAYLGLAVNSESAGSPVGRFRFYRQVADTSRDSPVLGR